MLRRESVAGNLSGVQSLMKPLLASVSEGGSVKVGIKLKAKKKKAVKVKMARENKQ